MVKYLEVNFTADELRRIFAKISFDENTECWNWTGAKIKNRGYGVFNFRGKTESVHRLIYSWFVKPIPRGKRSLVIDHIVCNNRACCNPNHMTLGTQKQNALRGDNPLSRNAKKTHCIHGHLLPKEPNELWGRNRKGRRCIICRRKNRMRRYYEKQGFKEHLMTSLS